MHAWSFASVAPTLLVAALLLLPGCEDDECSLDLTYSVIGGNTFQQVWRSPGATCSYGSLGTIDGQIAYEFEDAGITITLRDASFAVGSHGADLRVTDAAGKTWYSAESDGQVQASGCIAHIYSAETVDWVREDHLRVTGIVSCSGPLIDIQNPFGSLEGASLMHIDDLKFSIYAGDGGLFGGY